MISIDHTIVTRRPSARKQKNHTVELTTTSITIATVIMDASPLPKDPTSMTGAMAATMAAARAGRGRAQHGGGGGGSGALLIVLRDDLAEGLRVRLAQRDLHRRALAPLLAQLLLHREQALHELLLSLADVLGRVGQLLVLALERLAAPLVIRAFVAQRAIELLELAQLRRRRAAARRPRRRPRRRRRRRRPRRARPRSQGARARGRRTCASA